MSFAGFELWSLCLLSAKINKDVCQPFKNKNKNKCYCLVNKCSQNPSPGALPLSCVPLSHLGTSGRRTGSMPHLVFSSFPVPGLVQGFGVRFTDNFVSVHQWLGDATELCQLFIIRTWNASSPPRVTPGLPFSGQWPLVYLPSINMSFSGQWITLMQCSLASGLPHLASCLWAPPHAHCHMYSKWSSITHIHHILLMPWWLSRSFCGWVLWMMINFFLFLPVKLLGFM